jgi:hypothetical protein
MAKVGKSDGEATSPRRAATEGLRRLQTFPLRPGTGRFEPTAADADHLHRHQGAQRVELGDRLSAQDFGDTIEVYAEKALDLLSRRECTPPPVRQARPQVVKAREGDDAAVVGNNPEICTVA